MIENKESIAAQGPVTAKPQTVASAKPEEVKKPEVVAPKTPKQVKPTEEEKPKNPVETEAKGPEKIAPVLVEEPKEVLPNEFVEERPSPFKTPKPIAADDPNKKAKPDPNKPDPYERKKAPPTTFGKPKKGEKDRIIIELNERGNISSVEFEGRAGLFATKGRIRAWERTIKVHGRKWHQRRRDERLSANYKPKEVREKELKSK